MEVRSWKKGLGERGGAPGDVDGVLVAAGVRREHDLHELEAPVDLPRQVALAGAEGVPKLGGALEHHHHLRPQRLRVEPRPHHARQLSA